MVFHCTQISVKIFNPYFLSWPLADLGGRARRAPPYGSRFFRFDMQNFRNVAASGVHGPPMRSTPPYGKSWIRHWKWLCAGPRFGKFKKKSITIWPWDKLGLVYDLNLRHRTKLNWYLVAFSNVNLALTFVLKIDLIKHIHWQRHKQTLGKHYLLAYS